MYSSKQTINKVFKKSLTIDFIASPNLQCIFSNQNFLQLFSHQRNNIVLFESFRATSGAAAWRSKKMVKMPLWCELNIPLLIKTSEQQSSEHSKKTRRKSDIAPYITVQLTGTMLLDDK